MYIRNYMEGRGMPWKIKIGTILLLWTTIGLSIFFTSPGTVVKIVLLLVAVGVTLHVILIKTRRQQ